MKVVCLKSVRRQRSPYERMPFYPRSCERYVDEPLWDTIHFPIVPYRPWVLLVDEQGRKTSVHRSPAADESPLVLDDRIRTPSPPAQVEQTLTPSTPPMQRTQTSREVQLSAERELAPHRFMVPEGSQSPQQPTSAPPRLLTRPFESEQQVNFSGPSWKPPVTPRLHISDTEATSSNISLAPRHASLSPTEDSTTSSQVPSQSVTSSQHKLRKYHKTMHTFRSQGGTIDKPPRVAEAEEFDVYLHLGDDGDRVWYATAHGSWVPATFDMFHPQYPEYTLYLANDNWARWLLKKTVTTYKGRKVHEAQHMPRTPANGS